MNRVLRFLIRLYPAWWRRRYGRELEALLEDSGSRNAWDLLRGAMEIQMRTWSFGRIVAVCGIAGLLLAGLAAFSMPYRYRSAAILESQTRDNSPAVWNALASAAFTTEALSEIIRREHVYTGAPSEIGIDRMRRAISLQPTGPNLARVSFAYEDPAEAQRITRDLAAAMIAANLLRVGNPNNAVLKLTVPPGPPERQIEKKRYGLACAGLSAGLMFGAVLAFIFRRGAPIR